jgi:glycosyltransferase involved in cell wall biosynthesis
MALRVKRYTVLHTIETGGPGGAESVLLELASLASPERFRPLAFLPQGSWLPSQLAGRRVPYVISNSRAWYNLMGAMRKLVQREKVDLIHSHLDDQNFYSSVVGALTGCRTIVTYHGAPRIAVQQGLRRGVKSWVPRHFASQVVVVSDYLRELFVAAGFPAQRLRRIYNGVDLARFASQDSVNLREELGVPPHTRLVGMVANLRHSKGYEYFVESARTVVDAIPEACFLAVGETEAEMLARMKGLIRQLRLDERFFFLGFRSDVPQVLNALDVFVLSSTDEGLSIATLEAMAARRPVVVTLSGGPQEIVRDGETGFLVPPRDSPALAARIIEVLRDPQLAARLGGRARAAVEERFSLARMVAEYESLYDRCLEGK